MNTRLALLSVAALAVWGSACSDDAATPLEVPDARSASPSLSAAGSQVTAVSLVDQEQPVVDATVGGLFIGGGSAQKLAQIVTAGTTGALVAVGLPVACTAGSDLLIDIQGVAGNAPDGVRLASEVIPGSTLPSFFPAPPSFRTLSLSTPPSFTAGERFAIVLSSIGACGMFQGPVGNPYAGGDAFFDARPNQPGWVPLGPPRFDLPFQTIVTIVQRARSVDIDVWPGSEQNLINPRSLDRIHVAILSAPDFSAAEVVDRASLTFGATGDEASLSFCSGAQDVNGDGLLDLVCRFETQRTGFQPGHTEAILRGRTVDGLAIEGRDAVLVRNRERRPRG